MNILDLTIIYLALGAPLGVYHVATHWEGPDFSTFSFSILNVFLWPLASFVIAYDHLRKVAVSRSELISRYVQELNAVARADLSIEQVVAFRDCLATYAGLSAALENEIGTRHVEEIGVLAGNISIPVAKAVAKRSNREKLHSHRSQARDDFMNWIGVLCRCGPSARAVASDLAKAMGDDIGADRADGIRSQRPNSDADTGERVSIAA